jgi:transcriptional regulator with XRE-family HTH domain
MTTNSKLPEIRKEAFIKARENLGLSTKQLGGMVCLSTRQIEQIENGGNKSFYSEAIKLQSAKKVAKILGLTDRDAFVSKETKHSQQLPLPLPRIENPESAPILKTNLEEKVQTNLSPKVESKQVLKVKKKFSAELGKVSSISTHLEGVIASAKTDDDYRRQKTISYFKVFAFLGSAIAVVLFFTQYNHQSKVVKINPSIAAAPAIENQEADQAEVVKEIEPAKTTKASILEIATPKTIN